MLILVLLLIATVPDRSDGTGKLTRILGVAQATAEALWDGVVAAAQDGSRGQLRRNVLRMLTRLDPSLADTLNTDRNRGKLEIHHTVPYASKGAEGARRVLAKWKISISDPADAAILPDTYHRGEDVHGEADDGYNTRVRRLMNNADKSAERDAAEYGHDAGRAEIFDALRKLSDELVEGSGDQRAIALEAMLRAVEQALRPDTVKRHGDTRGEP